jgi:hypothetical protein
MGGGECPGPSMKNKEGGASKEAPQPIPKEPKRPNNIVAVYEKEGSLFGQKK